MTGKTKVKVIKKGEVKSVEEPIIVEKTFAKAAAREMVSTVSTWVNDFQQRRRDETKQALEKFFSPSPKASEL
jgi:hypothetical protein